MTNQHTGDIREIIEQGPLKPVQLLVICLCFSLNLLDGMDVLAISLAAPVLSEQWQIPPDTLGIVFGAALFGMMLGAVFVAPLADRIGRRRQIMGCLAVVGAAMLITALAESVIQLLVLRFAAGLGLGGIIPSMITMSSEFSPLHIRNLSVTVVQSGYALGIVMLGVIGAWSIPAAGWESVFVIPGILSFVALPLVYLYLPESPDFLLSKQPPGALSAINKLLSRMGRGKLQQLPRLPDSAEERRSGIRSLFLPAYLKSTVLLWAAFFFCFTTLFVLTSWTPQLMKNAGLSIEYAIYGGVTLNIGAFFGMITLGYLADRMGLRRIIIIWLLAATVLMSLFGYFYSPALIMLNILLIGFTVQGGFIGLFAAGARIYPTLIRNTGVGLAIGIARTGAIAGPYLAGLLVLYGFSMSGVFLVFALPVALTAVAVYLLPGRQLDMNLTAIQSSSRSPSKGISSAGGEYDGNDTSQA